MKLISQVCVFCSASPHVNSLFFSDIDLLGSGLSQKAIKVIYGGSQVGLMGQLAQSVIRQGGEIIGVVSDDLPKTEPAHPGLTVLHQVKTLSDRKRRLIQDCDAVLIYPGGIGTLDEAFEVLTLKQIGSFDRPIVFINMMGYWDSLFDALEGMWQQRAIQQNLSDFYEIVSDSEEALLWIDQWNEKVLEGKS